MDTERRIEKAFHEQTRYLSQQQSTANEKFDKQWSLTQEKLDNTIRWMIGLMVTMTIAIVLAVFFR